MRVPLGAHTCHIGITFLNCQCVLTNQGILHRFDISTRHAGRRANLTQTVNPGVSLHFDQRLDTVLLELDYLDRCDVNLVLLTYGQGF